MTLEKKREVLYKEKMVPEEHHSKLISGLHILTVMHICTPQQINFHTHICTHTHTNTNE